MSIGSLFSGIGGLELGVEWATGGLTVWQAESDSYCRDVLRKNWPGAHLYDDVRKVDFRAYRPDIICGGFPCQDISRAATWRKLSEREGLDGDKSGLWEEFARVVRTLGPRFVFVENVPALVDYGLGRVLGDLADLGYDAEWDCYSHLDVGGWTGRTRMFILAHLDRKRGEDVPQQDPLLPYEEREIKRVRGLYPDPYCPPWDEGWLGHVRGESEPVALLRGADARLPAAVDRNRALGNCVVPQVAAKAWTELYARAMRP